MALNADDGAKYEEFKAAILRRYDIREKTYVQAEVSDGVKEGGGGIHGTSNLVAGLVKEVDGGM